MSYANRYTATHKQWDHVGNLFPNVEHAEKGPHGRLAGDFIPAPWLPVQLWDVYFEAYTVCSPGKLVACTRRGEATKTPLGDWEDSQHLVPAGMKLAFGAGGAGLVYAAADVTARTIDLTTGLPVAAAVTYNAAAIATALIARGELGTGEVAANFISSPIGVAAHAFYQWAANNGAKFNPADLKDHNFRLQSQVQVLAMYQLRLPHVPTTAHVTAIPAWAGITGGAGGAGAAVPVWGTIDLHSAASLQLSARYAAAGTGAYPIPATATVIALALDHFPIATDPVVGSNDLGVDVGGVAATVAQGSQTLLRERASAAACVQAGDWWLDREVGLLVLWDANSGAGAVPAALGLAIGATGRIAYSDYTAAPAAVSNYASAVGDLKPGDMVVLDVNSNFEKGPGARLGAIAVATGGAGAFGSANAAADGDTAEAIDGLNDLLAVLGWDNGINPWFGPVGQVIGFKTYPKDLLHRVKSQYNNLGNLNAMPGTATKGLPDTLRYSGAADREVVINLVNR